MGIFVRSVRNPPKHSHSLFHPSFPKQVLTFLSYLVLQKPRSQPRRPGLQSSSTGGKLALFPWRARESKRPGGNHSATRAGASTLCRLLLQLRQRASPPGYNGVPRGATGRVQLKTRQITKTNDPSCSSFSQVTSSFHIIKVKFSNS